MKKKELLKRIEALEDQVSELKLSKGSWTYLGHPVSELAAWEIKKKLDSNQFIQYQEIQKQQLL